MHMSCHVVVSCVQMNVWLMMFNLFIPAYPLDGGRIFADLLLMAGVVADLAAKIVAGVALTIAVGLVVYGFAMKHLLTALVSYQHVTTTCSFGCALHTMSADFLPAVCCIIHHLHDGHHHG